MKKSILVLFTMLLTNICLSQVGINNANPDASSILDVSAANKGMLIPRVALTSTTDTVTIASPATSLLVFNTATVGAAPNNLTPGFYFYNGTAWTRVDSQDSIKYVGAINTTSNENGASISGSYLNLSPASDTNGGVLTTGTQTIGGVKTFVNIPTAPTATAGTNTTQLATTAFVTAANATNANLTGAVTSVGNATSLGSFTSANLATALTNETGSGSVVFSASPSFTGVPAVPTAAAGTSTTQIASTAFVTAANATNANLTGAVTSVGNATSLGSFTSANLAGALTDETGTGAAVLAVSPALTGVPTAPTAAAGTSTTQLATTAFVAAASVSNSVNLAVTDDNTTNANYYPTWVTNNTGNLPLRVSSTKFLFNPSSGNATINELTIGRGNGSSQTNTAFGIGALNVATPGSPLATDGLNNVAVGNLALNKITTSVNNVAIGSEALSTMVGGGGHVAIGYLSLKNSVAGYENTAVGNQSQLSNVGTVANTGIQNTSLGAQSLRNNVSGNQNTAIGVKSAFSSTGSNNTSVGFESLRDNLGSSNTAMGFQAMANNTGSNNVAIGNQAMYNTGTTSSGSNNTAIGYNANVTTAFSNSTAIGNGATVGASNTIRLGNTSVTSIGGPVAWTTASDARLKTNVTNSKYGLSTVLRLRPVDYILISNNLKQVGFIAQEVQKLIPEVVTGKEGDLNKGETLGITYANMVPVLTNAIQEQQKEIELQKKQLELQQKQIEKMSELITKLMEQKK